MEASDAFAQTTEIDPNDDPFANGDFGDFGEEADAPIATEGLPTVDREGQPVDPTPPPASAGPTDTRTEEQRAAEAAAYRESHGEPEPVRQDPDATQARLRAIAEREAAEKAAAAAQAPPEQVFDPVSATMQPPAAESAPVTAPPAAQEPPAPAPSGPQPGGEAVAPASAPGEPADPTPTAADGATGSTGEESAPPPAERKNASGKTTMRRYLVFKVTAPGKFEQVSWYEKDGKMTTERQPGSKRQGVALCRGTDDALKIGFAALGAPPEGVNLVAVAQAYFQPKPVRTQPPEPTRQRLVIG